MANHLTTDSTVKIGTSLLGELKAFTTTENCAPIDDSTINDTAKTVKAGPTSWTGSAEAFWDEADAGKSAITAGATVVFNAYFEGSGSGATYKTGSAMVESITTSATIDGIVEVSFTFTGNGALSTTTV